MSKAVSIALKFLLFSAISSFAFASGNESDDLKLQAKSLEQDVNTIVDHGGKYAYIQLARKNGLSPFAVGLDEQNNVVMLEVPKSEVKATFSMKVLKLREMLKLAADEKKFKAGALFVQAKVPYQGKDVNGVAIELEHNSGASILRFSPYEIDRANKDIKFKQPVDKTKPVVFFKDVLAQATEKQK